jgi:hypothetical protein
MGLRADILIGAFAVRAEGAYMLPALGKTGLIPTAGIAMGFMQAQTDAKLPDQAVDFQARAGLLKSF